MSFALYMVGVALFVGGLAWGLVTVGLGHTYVAIICVIALGLGVMGAVGRTRTKDISQ